MHDHFNSDKLCVTTSYIQDDIMIVFTMTFKCVLKILETCVNFTGLQDENDFCSWKMFTCRKLTGFETLLPVSITFQFNENTNTCIANSEYSDCVSHPNTHTHTHTHTHIQINIIYIYIYIHIQKSLMEFLRNFPSPLCAVAVSKFPVNRCCLITILYSFLIQTTVMDVHIIMTQPSSAVCLMS